jgi:hypothetical protein
MRLIRNLLALSALGAALTAMPAGAQPPAPTLMNRLERYCVSNNSDPEAAVRTARADGFVRPPDGVVPGMPSGFDDMQALWAVHDGGVAMLLIGSMKDPRSGLGGDICAVASMPQSPQAIKDLERWLGIEIGAQPFVIYAEDEQGKRSPLTSGDERAAREAARKDQLRGAGARTDKQMTMLMLMHLRL